MIQTHLYARNTETPVFDNPRKDGHPSFILHEGSWMGVLEEKGEWVHVITVEGDGWVEREFAELRSPGDLHVVLSGDFRVDYVNSVIGNL